MAKKSKKTNLSFAELEMESYATAQPDIHEDRSTHILRIIEAHAAETAKAKKYFLLNDDVNMYARYGDIEAAFDILKEDLRREGFAI